MTDREGNYTYDPKSRRFRAPDGRYVSAAEVVGLRDHIIAAKSARTVSLVNSLYAGTISPSAFVLSMRDEIKRTVLMEYMLGRGGLNAMTSADYGRIGSILKPQYQYLNTFVTQIMDGNVTKDQAIRRAGMYIDSTRVAHERAKGVAWDVNLPAYPGIHPNCVVPLTPVDARGINAGYRHRYDGDVVTLHLESGNSLTVTPNHPVATERGWIAAGLIDRGGKVLQAGFIERDTPGDPQVNDAVATIDEVVEALGESRLALGPVNTVVDFHGDVANSDVYVIDADRPLPDDLKPAIAKMIRDRDLVVAHPSGNRTAGDECVSDALVGNGPSFEFDNGRLAPTGSSIGSSDSHSALTIGHRHVPVLSGIGQSSHRNTLALQYGGDSLAGYGEPVCQHDGRGAILVEGDDISPFLIGEPDTSRGGVARINPGRDKTLPDHLAVDTDVLADGTQRPSVEVESLKVVGIDRTRYTGHVYNLSTASGWFLANGIIIHNCACDWDIQRKGDAVHAYWRTRGGKSCVECENNESTWNPLVLEGPDA